MATALWAYGLVFLGTIIGAFGPIFLKKGSGKFSLNPIKLIKNYNVIIGCGLYGISTVVFVPALRGGELSTLYPVVSLSYIWVILLSKYLLGEHIGKKWYGIAAIILGVILVGLGS